MNTHVEVVRFKTYTDAHPNLPDQLGWTFNTLIQHGQIVEIGMAAGTASGKYGGAELAGISKAGAAVREGVTEEGALHSVIRLSQPGQYGSPDQRTIGAITALRNPGVLYREPGMSRWLHREHKFMQLHRAFFLMQAFVSAREDQSGDFTAEALRQTLHGLEVPQGLGMYAVTMLQEEQVDNVGQVLERAGFTRVGAVGFIALGGTRESMWPTNTPSSLYANAPVGTTVDDLARPL